MISPDQPVPASQSNPVSPPILIEALRTVVSIDVSQAPQLRDTVAEAWAGALARPSQAAVAAADRIETVALDGAIAASNPRAALTQLTSAVTRKAIESRRGELWLLHAAGLADSAGRVLVFAGASGAGKTTLVRRAPKWMRYVTDETVGIDSDGGVFAYRKPLSVLEPCERGKRQIPPSELGLVCAPDDPLRLHAIVLLDRSEMHPSAPQIDFVDPLQAVFEAAPHTSYLSSLRSPLQTVYMTASTRPVVRLRYRNDTDLDGVLSEIMALDAPSWPRPVHECPVIAPPRPLPGPDVTTYSRAPFLDALSGSGSEHRIAVLLEGADQDSTNVALLSGISPAVWRQACGAPLSDIISGVVAAYGSPAEGDPRSLITTAVGELVSVGALVARRGR